MVFEVSDCDGSRPTGLSCSLQKTCICLRTGNRSCFLQLFELAHMFDATQHLGLHTCSMLRNIWACTHVRCYATSGLAHMFDATQHLGLHTCSMLRNIWACTHGCCYATPWGGGWVGMMMFFGLAHMLDATELLMFFRACTHVGLHCCAWTYDCCLRRYIIY